uniref:PDZ domain-containing protein n=1 Tax=Pyrodinium bahamense TaxID=73915 RepID=A0A7S0A4Z2_9DINO
MLLQTSVAVEQQQLLANSRHRTLDVRRLVRETASLGTVFTAIAVFVALVAASVLVLIWFTEVSFAELRWKEDRRERQLQLQFKEEARLPPGSLCGRTEPNAPLFRQQSPHQSPVRCGGLSSLALPPSAPPLQYVPAGPPEHAAFWPAPAAPQQAVPVSPGQVTVGRIPHDVRTPRRSFTPSSSLSGLSLGRPSSCPCPTQPVPASSSPPTASSRARLVSFTVPELLEGSKLGLNISEVDLSIISFDDPQAMHLGFRVGDRIVQVSGRPVSDQTDLLQELPLQFSVSRSPQMGLGLTYDSQIPAWQAQCSGPAAPVDMLRYERPSASALLERATSPVNATGSVQLRR